MNATLQRLAPAPRPRDRSAPATLFPPLRPLWGRLQRAHGCHIRPVYDEQQRRLVSALVRRRYAWRGYATAALDYPAGDANRLTLAAWQYGELAATLTLGRDSPRGLDADALYAAELDRLREPPRVLCEVTRLAVDPDFAGPDLLTSLFAAAFDYGRRLYAASDVVIGVNPRHVGYYQRRLGFRRIGAQRHCACVDAPVVLLHQAVDGCGCWESADHGRRRAGNAA